MGRIFAYVGGARSGKSRLAVERAREFADGVFFIATLEPKDDEMRERVASHRRARPASWRTVEAPRMLARAIGGLPPEARCAVVDCLTLWTSNLLCDGLGSDRILEEFDEVVSAARASPADVVFVSNEVGCGIVPESALARAFRDVAGVVNQRLASAADEAYWVTCGRAITLA